MRSACEWMSPRGQVLDALERVDEPVDFFGRVVDGKRGTNGRLNAEAPQRGLRTVVAGADGDAFLVEQASDFFGPPIGQHEREDAHFFASRADQCRPFTRERPSV